MRGRRCVRGVLVLVLALGGRAGADRIDTHGLVSQGYLRSTANNYLAASEAGSFDFSEAIVSFSTTAGQDLRVGLQLMARDLGAEGNSEVTLDWAYADYRLQKNLGVRFGKLKSHIGLYNKGRDVDALRTAILLPQTVYEETTRDLAHSYNGFSLYGNPLVPGLGRVNCEVYAGSLPIRDPNSYFWQNNLRIVTGRMAFLRGLDLSSRISSVTVEHVVGGMLMWHTPLSGLQVGGNLIRGRIGGRAQLEGLVPLDRALAGSGVELPGAASGVNGVRRIPFDIEVDIDRLLTLSAEYTRSDLLVATEVLSTRFDVRAMGFPTEVRWYGYYLMATYRLSDRLEVGSYGGRFYPDGDDRDGRGLAAQGRRRFEAWREDLALCTRVDLNDNWLVKAEVHRMDGAAWVLPDSNPADLERTWYLFLAKVSAHF